MKPIISLLLLAGFAGGVVINIPTSARKIMPPVFYNATRPPNATYQKTATLMTCEEAAGKLPFNCIDLKETESFANIDTERGVSYAKQTTSNGFTWQDVRYIADENCELSDACTTDQSILTYDVFYPTDYPYTTCTTLPPCVIHFKAGGFSDCSTAEDALNLEIVAKMLAKRGFVVFAPRYRTGRILSDKKVLEYGPFTNIAFTTAQQNLAFYRAFQDCRGAIRSIIKRNRETTSLLYPAKFDENNLFIGGFSAGAICAIHSAYYPTKDMINMVAGGANVSLGNIDEDFYYGEPSIKYQSKIKAVLNCWGNGFIPENKKDNPQEFFPVASKIPLISFHGKKDLVCPYNNQPVFYPPDYPPNNLSDKDDPLHLNIIVNPIPICPTTVSPSFMLSFGGSLGEFEPDSWRYGSKKMFCFLRSINVYTEFYLDDEMGHGVKSIYDNFGASYSTVPAIYGYIAVRAATFFQAILYGQTNPSFLSGLINASNNKLFEECENFRVSCAPSNTPACAPEPSNFCTTND